MALLERDKSAGLARCRYELHFKAVGWVHLDDCTEIAGAKPVLLKIAGENNGIERFVLHVYLVIKQPKDWPRTGTAGPDLCFRKLTWAIQPHSIRWSAERELDHVVTR